VITASPDALEGCAAHVEYLRCPAADLGATPSRPLSSPIDLAGALARLRGEHGVRSILCEGGPSLNASLFAAGVVDELFLTTVPKIAGGAGALTIVGAAPLETPLDAWLQWLLEHDGELYARYAVHRSG
jgi:riboflavin biosynthesis pyrimidine reductase